MPPARLLTASELVGLDLDADLVILSACNSGGPGGTTAGESLSGLARAFFYAGARSLLVTHWSVNDQVAAFLVADTLRRMKENPALGVAGSLRDAQLAMLADAGKGLPAEIAHPFFWAPFAVIGEGGERVMNAERGFKIQAGRVMSPTVSTPSRARPGDLNRARAWRRRIETLGKYEIKRTLGRGAMGIVYEGWDPIIARRVAIKTVRVPDTQDDPETEEALARFRREAQAAGRLTHPNIVGVFDYGETGDIAYIVMEYVDGPSVKSLVDKQERFAIADTMRIMKDLLDGLQFSHARGVVHRDIKPANVMLTSDGQAKIADFGIARIESSVDDPGRHGARHAGLHVARAVHGPGGGCADRHLLVGRAAVPVADRRAAVRGRHVGDHAQGAEHRPAAAVADYRHLPARRSTAWCARRWPSGRRIGSSRRWSFWKRCKGRQPAGLCRSAEPAEADDSEATMVAAAPRRAGGFGCPGRATRPPRRRPPAQSLRAPKRSNLPMIAAAVVVVVLLLGGGAWFFLLRGPSAGSEHPGRDEQYAGGIRYAGDIGHTGDAKCARRDTERTPATSGARRRARHAGD